MPAVRRDPVDELADIVLAMNPADLERWCLNLTGADLELIESIVAGSRHHAWVPLPHQIPPSNDDPWELWLLLGGRGTGKTDACAADMDAHAKGPPCLPGLPGGHRMAIIAPTRGDASDSCVNSPAGLKAHNPLVREVTRKGGTVVLWPNGAEAKLFGAFTPEDVERLRAGGNRCRVWCEELAAWRYLRACWNHMTLGLRLGPSPRAIASTTPKNRKHLRKLIADPNTIVTTASTYDNPHLAAEVRAKYERLYKGTRLGRQELLAELLDDVEGALWNLAGIEADRVDERAQYRRIVVGVDPSWGTTNDECGIVVAGATWTDEAHVLADYSIRGGPSVWAESVAEAFWTWQADIVAAEGNFQGEQVRLAMGQVEHPLGAPATKLVNASRGKVLRAEPVVMLYEQHRVHHLGVLEGLEYQMTTWVPGAKADDHDEDDDADLQADVAQGSNIEHEGSQDDDELAVSEYSPDRIDALVFAVTDLLLGESGTPLVVRQQRRLDKPSVERSVGMRTPRRVGRRL